MQSSLEWLTVWRFAHRGLHGSGLPENSLGAFSAAADAGYAIELDVQLCADDQLVVFHDENTRRMTGRKLVLADTNYTELSELKLDQTGYGIPVLSDVLRLINGRVPLLIEVKTYYRIERVGQALMKAVESYQGSYAVQSFDPRLLNWLKKHAPQVTRGILGGRLSGLDRLNPIQRIAVSKLLLSWYNRPHFIAYNIRDLPCTAVTFWKAVLSVPVLAWTIKSEADYKKAADLGVNIIFESIRPPKA
jgi:glycerophosphoryl diester phosphodiesterase